MNYKKIPKIELHRHLEGSVRLSTIADEARKQNLSLPYKDLGQLRDKCQVLKPMESLMDVINVFWNTQSVLGTPDAIQRITFELLEDAFKDGIYALEIRYSPEFLTHNHELSFSEALMAIEAGIAQGRAKYDIQVGLIGIVSRMFPIESGEKTLDHMLNFRNSFIGFDLADDEKDLDFEAFKTLTENAKQQGIGISIHSGEEIGTEVNVVPTIDILSATRIGHGLQIIRDAEILSMVREREAILEICPTSNYLTNAVKSTKFHPAKALVNKGIRICINSDDPGVFGIDLSNEYRVCMEELGFSKQDIQNTLQNALNGSFLDADIKKYLQRKYFDFLRVK